MARRVPKSANPSPGLFDAPARPASVPVPPEECADSGPRPLSVTELTAHIKASLEATGRIAVEGELSGLRRHTSGHVYFDLKDSGSRVSCVIWRSRARTVLAFDPDEGVQVVAHGKLDVYAPRGSYSLIVDRLEPVGVGALLAELEALKAELRSLGWFERKRPIPRMPRRIGIVTSRDGAALRDFLRTRSLRWPSYPVRLCHSVVQGPGAAVDIAASIDALDASGVDVIVLCRGGGSLEDLWAFNERPVAEAMWRSRTPIVSGVGHESDTTLVDWIADVRAHTPTDAAQRVIPDRKELSAELNRQSNYLMQAVDGLLSSRGDRLANLASRPALRSAGWILGNRSGELRSLSRRLASAVESKLGDAAQRSRTLQLRLEQRSPRVLLERYQARVARASGALRFEGARRMDRARSRFQLLAGRLESLSPLAVLARGYSVTYRAKDRSLVRSVDDAAPGDELITRLGHGELTSRVVSRSRAPGTPGAEGA